MGGTKIFNWLSSYLGNPPFFTWGTSSALFALLFLLMFTIGGSTGIILGNAAVSLGLHDTYYAVAHFHFVLSLGAVIAIFSGIIFNGEKIVDSKSLLPSPSSTLSLYHLVLIFVGILLTFYPMHFLGFNVMPRRIPNFPDSFHFWNFLSSIGSGITLLSFAMLKAVPNKNAGFIILLTSILILFFCGEIRNLTTFTRLMDCNNGFSLSLFFLSFCSFLWIGSQFPQEKFLSYGRILTLYYYFLLMCILFPKK